MKVAICSVNRWLGTEESRSCSAQDPGGRTYPAERIQQLGRGKIVRDYKPQPASWRIHADGPGWLAIRCQRYRER
jgi:hypothetical protein